MRRVEKPETGLRAGSVGGPAPKVTPELPDDLMEQIRRMINDAIAGLGLDDRNSAYSEFNEFMQEFLSNTNNYYRFWHIFNVYYNTQKTWMARTTEAAPAATNLTCNLVNNAGTEITSGPGSGIEVYCKVSGGGNLNAAIPRLADNDYLFVTFLQNKWWCTTVFQTSEDCVCN